MQAIILAAGMGRRLGEYTKDNTKCMLPVNGVRLIDRVLTQLSNLDLKRVVIVVGYQGQNLIDYIGHRYDNNFHIEYVNNPIYDKTNNIYSLALAKQQLQEDDTLLIESDLIYDDGLFELLVNNPHPDLALVAKYESWMDGTMVRIDDDYNITDFVSKEAFSFKDVDSYYKTVNIYKFSKEFSHTKYVPFLDAYCKAMGNNEYYENVLRIITFLNDHSLKALPVTHEKWYEIDDKQDLDIAEALFADEKDLLRKFYGRFGGYWRFPQMLDFCYLVNPYFPPQKLIDEMQSQFKTLLTQYPSGMKVNSLLASKCYGVSEEYIIPGNGAAELISALMEHMQGTVGFIRPTFEEYPNRFDPSRQVTFVPQNDEYRYSADDLMAFFTEHPVDTLLLINPDNPSGNYIPKADVLRLAQWCQEHNMRLVVDESFVDFCEDFATASLLSDAILEQHPNMVVMKSISKSFGVPGLRLGVLASANKPLIAEMKKRVSIWNLNSFAEFYMQIYTKYERDYQRAHNILTRDCSTKPGLDGRQYMRIAVRDHADNTKLVNSLLSLAQTIQ